MNEIRKIFNNELKLRSDKWDPYFDVYETYFSPFVGKSPTLVEVGVQGGGSIEMWKKYLGENSKIIGIDVDINVINNHLNHFDDGVEICLGDQGSEEFWDNFLQKNPNIDLFIDDGGHHMQQQIITFEKVFPVLNMGGVYICEDTHTSYWKVFGSKIYNYGSFIEYSKRIVDIINKQHVEEDEKFHLDEKIVKICEDLTTIHFYDSMVVFIKNGRKEFKNVFANR